MAVHFMTNSPSALLTAFKKAIDDGHVVTWSYNADDDFTHTAEQWKNKAWFRPAVKSDRLTFNVIKPKNAGVSTEVYAIYHGRIIEPMLAHFDKMLTSGIATAMPEANDLVS